MAEVGASILCHNAKDHSTVELLRQFSYVLRRYVQFVLENEDRKTWLRAKMSEKDSSVSHRSLGVGTSI